MPGGKDWECHAVLSMLHALRRLSHPFPSCALATPAPAAQWASCRLHPPHSLPVPAAVSFFERGNNAHFNSLAVADADGSIVAHYRWGSALPMPCAIGLV